MELWDVYTYDREKTGRTMARGAAFRPGEYHLVSDMWLINRRGEVLIQKRSMNKETAPGLWSCTGGSVTAGEDTWQGMYRELEEELGIRPEKDQVRLAFSCHGKYSIKDVFLIRYDAPLEAFHIQAEEVDAIRWVSLEELKTMIREPGVFHRLGYFDRLFEALEKELVAC